MLIPTYDNPASTGNSAGYKFIIIGITTQRFGEIFSNI